jgi:hypothetical protein
VKTQWRRRKNSGLCYVGEDVRLISQSEKGQKQCRRLGLEKIGGRADSDCRRDVSTSRLTEAEDVEVRGNAENCSGGYHMTFHPVKV